MNLLTKIETREDIEIFFRYLIFDEDLNLHPDTSFNNYTNCDGSPSYTPEQCAERERLLDQCFALAGDAVYDIGLPLLLERLDCPDPAASNPTYP